MKRSNFFKLFIASLFMIAIIGIFSCGDKEPCEENHTGTITIYNDFPGAIIVDVYDYRVEDFLGERTLGIGMHTTYTVHAGDIEIWETDAYSDWGYWMSYVSQCEDAEFSIYQGKGMQHDTGNPLDIDQKLKGDRK